MKNLYKRAAARDGFTLVELIVVIAILGILAGIAIPVYSGYIKKANEAADYQLLDSVKTAAVFAATEANIPSGVTVSSITVGTDATAVTVAYSEAPDDAVDSVDISEYLNTNTISYKSGATGATWSAANGGSWTLTKAASGD